MNPARPANNKPPDLRWGITQKWIIRWSLACTLAIAASHASAEDVAQLGSAIETDKIALTGLQTDMNQKTSENERLKKEYDIYADQVKTRIGPMVKSNTTVAAHNSVCHSKLPQPAFQKCQGVNAPLQRMIDGVNSDKRNLDGEKARIQTEQTRYKNAMDPLAAKMKANFEVWSQQKARFD